MSEIKLIVLGAPVAKGRARLGNGHVYTPPKTAKYENAVKWEALRVMAGRQPFDAPLGVEVVAQLPIPPSWSKKKREQAARGFVMPASRPDLDNYVKAALDGMNKIVFRDDSQVVAIIARKEYSEAPRLEIGITELRA